MAACGARSKWSGFGGSAYLMGYPDTDSEGQAGVAAFQEGLQRLGWPSGDKKAYRQLQRLADEQRKRAPDLTKEQAFERAFAANPQLAAKAHVRPKPYAGGVYPFPR